MKNLFRWTLTLLGALLLCAMISGVRSAHAQSGAAFLEMDPSPRNAALGETGANAAPGTQSIGANPANVGAAAKKFEAFTSFSSPGPDEQFTHAAFAINRSIGQTRRIEGLAFAFTQLSIAGAEGRDRNGTRTGTFGSADRALSMAASTRLGNRLRAGLTGKFIQSEISGHRAASTFAADFGLSGDVETDAAPLTLGLALRNIGPGLRFISQTDPLPASINAGAAVKFSRLALVAEAAHNLPDRRTDFRTGMELSLGAISLRTGLSSLAGRSGSRGATETFIESLSYGIGLKLGSFRFDYALAGQAGEPNAAHRAALTFSWGAASTEKPAQAP